MTDQGTEKSDGARLRKQIREKEKHREGGGLLGKQG